MVFTDKQKNTLFKALRQFAYFVGVLGGIFGLHLLSYIFHGKTFDEFGIAENIQLLLLILSGSIFWFESRHNPSFELVLKCLASLCFLASCRELDAFFDRTIPFVSWRIGFIFPLFACWQAVLRKKEFIRQCLIFFENPAFYMMCAAMFVIIPVAQCIGHGPFVSAVLGDRQVRDIKEFFEESCETLGYLMILFSSVEVYFDILKKK